MPTLFFSYSHKDQDLRDQLELHLSQLKRSGLISAWHDRKIEAGEEFVPAITGALEGAEIILLLVSADFIASDYCYEEEMMRALERHRSGTARVIPVILRACDWQRTPFGKLQAVPTDGKPVRAWSDVDAAFLNITCEIDRAVKQVSKSAYSPQVRAREAKTPKDAEPLLHRGTPSVGVLGTSALLASGLEAPLGLFGCAIVSFDLDNFKQVNERLTPRVVDRDVLSVIKRTVVAAAQLHGNGYSVGGDEMVVVLPNSTQSMGAEFANALRELLSQLSIQVGNEILKITASFGVGAGKESKAALDDAHLARDFAKRQGKNCVAIAVAGGFRIWTSKAD